jgi:hypothetical protein
MINKPLYSYYQSRETLQALLTLHDWLVVHFFALMQRNEPKKNQASPSRSRYDRARAAQKMLKMAFNAKRIETRPAP